MPMCSPFTPAMPQLTTRATGLRPSASTLDFVASTTRAAPSLMPEALPGVTLPPGLKAAFSVPSFSRVVSRMCSSFSTSLVPPLAFTSTGTISLAKRPPSEAARARCWLRRAKVSISSRVMPWASERISQVPPMITPQAGSTKTESGPSRGSSRVWLPRKPSRAFLRMKGARLMASVPPARASSLSPSFMAWVALTIACMPDPHSRFTTRPVMVSGMPSLWPTYFER
ncbi:hypothetical protein D3C72_1192190 [compost metagenome]